METPWKYTDERRAVVFRTNKNGLMESCIASREDVQAWVKAGNVILEPDAPRVE